MGLVRWFSGLHALVTNTYGLSSVTGIQMVKVENQLATGWPLTSTLAEQQAHTRIHTIQTYTYLQVNK